VAQGLGSLQRAWAGPPPSMLKDEGKDPHGGVQYSRYERVRVERSWCERLDKESGLQKEQRKSNGPPRYVMNLANVSKWGPGSGLQDAAKTMYKMAGGESKGCEKGGVSHCRLEIIADKVQKQSPEERMSMEGFDPNSFEAVAMKYVEKTPTQKWDLPNTRSQEIGWLLSHPAQARGIRDRQQSKSYSGSRSTSALHSRGMPTQDAGHAFQRSSSQPHTASEPPRAPSLEELGHLNSRKFYKPRNFCPITRYADTYKSLMHHDPFSTTAAR